MSIVATVAHLGDRGHNRHGPKRGGHLVVCLFSLSILCFFFWFNLDYSVLLLFAFIVLGLASSVLRQEIGSNKKRLQNHLFCVEWDVIHDHL